MRSIEEVSSDLEKDKPMLRLLHGDVGSGKTLVALLACLQTYYAKYQCVLLAPTELLANTNEADAGNSTEIVDYCFDASNNLYAIVKQTVATTSYSIYKYEYNSINVFVK